MIYSFNMNKPNINKVSFTSIQEACDKEFETFDKIMEAYKVVTEAVAVGDSKTATRTYIEHSNVGKAFVKKIKQLSEKLVSYIIAIKAKLIDKFNKLIVKANDKVFKSIRDHLWDKDKDYYVYKSFGCYYPVFTKDAESIELEHITVSDESSNIFKNNLLDLIQSSNNQLSEIIKLANNIQYNFDVNRINKKDLSDKEKVRNKTSIENENYTESERDFKEKAQSIISTSNYKNIPIKKLTIEFDNLEYSTEVYALIVGYIEVNASYQKIANSATELYGIAAEEQKKMNQALSSLYKVIENSNADKHSYNLDTIIPIKNDLSIIKLELDISFGIYKALIKCIIGNVKEAFKVVKKNNIISLDDEFDFDDEE